MEKVWVTTKKGRIAYRKASLSSDEMKVMEFLMSNKSATTSQIEVGGNEMWVVRSMERRNLVKRVEE